MSQPIQATPIVKANLAGASTSVNLRDWLNTRLSPFLKRAIIESLDAEAEYPLQWLGEQLILQSIEFEGNPDSTNVRERFLYKHETTPKPAPASSTLAADAPPQSSTLQPTQIVTSQDPPASVAEPQAEPAASTVAEEDAAAPLQPADQAPTVAPATEINGTTQLDQTNHTQDTEMSNAP